MNPPLLLHVGYHKTATTWMQKLLFTPDHGFQQIADHRDVFSHIVQPHGFDFDPAIMRDLISNRMASVQEKQVPVISSEILSGHPFQGGHESDIYAERLARIAPGARILISVRNQMRILPSIYMQYLLRGGTLPYDRFFEGTDEVGYFGFTPKHFEYDRLVRRYQELFGISNVYVLPQESIQVSMDDCAAAVALFCENTAYRGLTVAAKRIYAPSYPEYAAPILRRVNQVQASTLNPAPLVVLGQSPKGLYKIAGYILRHRPFSTIFGGRKPITAHVRKRFSGYYRDSNARLVSLISHPIYLAGYEGGERL